MIGLPGKLTAWQFSLVLAATVFASRAYSDQPAGAQVSAAMADKAAFEKICGACHSPTMIDSFRSEPDWRSTVANMIQLGANGTEEQMDAVMRYLLRVWTRININAASPEQISRTIGVSESITKKIVDARARGNLRNCEDLIRVTGLAALRDSCRDRIVFE